MGNNTETGQETGGGGVVHYLIPLCFVSLFLRFDFFAIHTIRG
jgi:hypothetical protein